MSTAVAEPPPATDQAKVEALPPNKAEQDAILASIRRPKVEVTSVVQHKVEKPVEKVAEAKTDPPKEPVKTEVKAEAKDGGKDPGASWAELRKQKEEAEQRATERELLLKTRDEEMTKLQQEFETYRKNPVPKEVEERLTKAEQERAEYQKELRIAALHRDPEFNRKYDTGIQSAMKRMVESAVAAGVDKTVATKAVSMWDRSAFGEWAAGMGDMEKLEFGASMQRAVELHDAKQSELENADTTWQQLQQQREADQKQQQEQYRGLLAKDADDALKELSAMEIAKLHPDATKEAEALMRRAAGLNGERPTSRELLGIVGKSLLLARGFEKQAETIKSHEDKIAELVKKLGEQEAFIKEQRGAEPGISSAISGTPEDKKALVNSFLNPRVG